MRSVGEDRVRSRKNIDELMAVRGHDCKPLRPGLRQVGAARRGAWTTQSCKRTCRKTTTITASTSSSSSTTSRSSRSSSSSSKVAVVASTGVVFVNVCMYVYQSVWSSQCRGSELETGAANMSRGPSNDGVKEPNATVRELEEQPEDDSQSGQGDEPGQGSIDSGSTKAQVVRYS